MRRIGFGTDEHFCQYLVVVNIKTIYSTIVKCFHIDFMPYAMYENHMFSRLKTKHI